MFQELHHHLHLAVSEGNAKGRLPPEIRVVYCTPLGNQPISANFIAFPRSCKEWRLVVIVQSIHWQSTFLQYLAKKFSRTFVAASRSKHEVLPMLVHLPQIGRSSSLQSFRFGTCLKVSKGILLLHHGCRGAQDARARTSLILIERILRYEVKTESEGWQSTLLQQSLVVFDTL